MPRSARLLLTEIVDNLQVLACERPCVLPYLQRLTAHYREATPLLRLVLPDHRLLDPRPSPTTRLNGFIDVIVTRLADGPRPGLPRMDADHLAAIDALLRLDRADIQTLTLIAEVLQLRHVDDLFAEETS